MGRTDIYGRLRIKEENGVLTAQFKRIMKYGKLENEVLDIIEVEYGVEVDGSLTEQELQRQGYKPVCEVEKPDGAEGFVYKDYGTCYVQIWKMPDEDIRLDEIWTSDSGLMPEYSDLKRLKRDLETVKGNINTIDLSNKEKNEIKELFPNWADYIGESLNEIGFTVLYSGNNKLYEIIQPVSPVLEHQTPDLVPANYGLVSEHDGTKEDPIPYEHWMLIKKDKYYTENGKLYIGLMNAPSGYDADLSTLTTLAKEAKE